jgi:hypothetical protein
LNGHKRLSEGGEGIHHESQSGRQKTTKIEENIEKMRNFVSTHQRMAIEIITEELRMAKKSVNHTLNISLERKNVCVKMVLK